MIALDQVTKTYPGDVKALKGISLQIKKGEFVFWWARVVPVRQHYLSYF